MEVQYLMKRTMVITLLVSMGCSLANILALAAPGRTQGWAAQLSRPSKDTSGFGRAVKGYRLKLEVKSDVIVEGEQPRLFVTLMNVGRKPVVLRLSNPDYDYVMEIVNPEGTVSRIWRKPGPFRRGRNARSNLGPGQSLTESYQIGDLYDFDKLGAYRITASRRLPSLVDNGVATVVSNTVVLRVIEDKGASPIRLR